MPLTRRIIAIQAIKPKNGPVEYREIRNIHLEGKDKFGDPCDAPMRDYVDAANRMQDEFDADCDPVRVYLYLDNIPTSAMRSSKINLCHILNKTDGGTVRL